MSEELKTIQESEETEELQTQESESLEINEEEQEVEEEQETEEVDEIDEPEDKVPLKTHLETKKKLREARLKLEEFEREKYANTIKAKRESVRKKWVDKGFEEETAALMADELAEIYEEIGSTRQAQSDSIIDEEIEDLSELDFYSDIKNWSKDIKLKISQFKNAGETLKVEDAYIMVAGYQIRDKKTRSEQKAIIDKKKNGATSRTNVQTSASKPIKNPYPLDPIDRKALAGLKKAQPDVAWTEKKYYEMRYK